MDPFLFSSGLVVAAVLTVVAIVLSRKWRILPRHMKGIWIAMLLLPFLYSLFVCIINSFRFGITTAIANLPAITMSIYILAIFYPIGIGWLIVLVALSIVTLSLFSSKNRDNDKGPRPE
jgi:hypothetical protein